MSHHAHAVNPAVSYTVPWDAGKMFGCVCDSGYAGHDCSLRACFAPTPRV